MLKVFLLVMFFALFRVGKNISQAQMREIYESGSIRYNPDPAASVRKDTVIIPDGGYALLRFYTNNPGVWIFHCHLAFHLEAGKIVCLNICLVNLKITAVV